MIDVNKTLNIEAELNCKEISPNLNKHRIKEVKQNSNAKKYCSSAEIFKL
jgi:hypothetical protein